MGIAIAITLLLWLAVETTHRRTARLLRARMAVIERENIHLAGGIVKAQKLAQDVEHGLKQDAEALITVAQAITNDFSAADADLNATIEAINQRLLTLENKQPKIAARAKTVNWRNFRSAIERSTEPEEAE